MGGRPLGIFDSGVGGLTVVGAILRRFPNEQILYVADQAHVPYGGRPLEEIKQFATGISRFLADEGCRGIIMACNISSAVALPSVRQALAPLPVFGMIEAAAKQAAVNSDSPIGVLATAGTVKSKAYTCHLQEIAEDARVFEIACPAFVPLVEAGETETEDALQVATEYLTPLARAGCRTIILGCTHYPFLMEALTLVAGKLWTEPPVFIDPANELIDQVQSTLKFGSARSGERLFLTTGDRRTFESQAPMFLPDVSAEVGASSWGPNGLVKLEMAACRR